MKIRLNTMRNTPRFSHEGINLTPQFSEVELDDLSPAGRDALELHTGTIIGIHPDDRELLEQAVGLKLEAGRFKQPEDDKGPPIGERHQSRTATTVDTGDRPAVPTSRPGRPAKATDEADAEPPAHPAGAKTVEHHETPTKAKR